MVGDGVIITLPFGVIGVSSSAIDADHPRCARRAFSSDDRAQPVAIIGHQIWHLYMHFLQRLDLACILQLAISSLAILNRSVPS